ATGLASITLGAGGSVTCTYTNTKDATVTIVKDAVPDDAQDFAFTTTGSGPAGFTGGFSLDDDADATLPNSVTFTFPAAQQGAKTIVEGATAGWSLTNLVCTGDGDSSVSTATRTATLDVDPGEAITCTYTNTHDATVTIVKNAVPDNGQDFGYTTTGTGLSAFTLDDDGAGGSATPNSTTFTIPAAQFGGKTITETAVSGWSLTNLVCTGDSASSTDTATRTATLDVSAGEAITCTYTNTKDATVTIVKDALPDDAQDFGYTTTGSGLSPFTLDDDGAGGSATPNQTTFTIPAAQFGQKSVTESATSGWTLTDLTCSGASITYSNNNTAGIAQTATFTVGAGDAVTCTYTNTEDAKITIVKDADPADGTNFDYSGDLGAFQLDEGGAADAVNTSETFTIPGNELGTKGVTEAAKAAWTNTDITCVGSSSFTPDLATRSVNVLVEAGDDITCTFTNVKDATVTIVKDAVPNDAQDFAFTTTGTGAAGFTGGFSLDDDANATLPNTRTFTFPAAQLGAKTVVEGATSGWTLTNLSCSGDDNSSTSTVTRTATLDVEAGEAITCTYTNTKNPTIIVRKVTTGIAGGPFTFTTTGGNGLTTPFNLTTAAPGTPVQQSFAISAAGVGGDYSVTESALAPGFAFTDAACEVTVAGVAGTTTGSTPATRSVSITNLTAGTTVTCTFVNSGIGTTRTQGFWSTHLSLVQLVWNPAGGTIGTITHNGMTDAERTICDLAPIGVYDPAVDVGPLTVAQVMGGFWSNVSKTTTGAKRSSLDHARMLLLQQLLAAILNNQLFGSTPSGITIDQAKAAYCGTNINAIKAAATAMAAFNEGGDTGLFTPGASADPKAAKAIANLVYWNVLP
ncbi:MAG: hypothetical protein ACJ778_13765, partial [Chloroflexota bacterium]